ncbi:MAG TPA: ABC transporter permease [Planctomycetes bacterium]|nr:ABC transporter permease [Planctomycetaceae bacterium]HIN95650.1 ABC transporter permease [Planctomycetota bacterium]
MYKLLLAWRYLRTRYIALASIISVTLGVATLIVVNSVMAGFTEEMHKRLHGILSDVVVESHDLNGLPDPEWHMEQIRQVIPNELEGMTASVHVPAMLNFQYNGTWVTRQVQLIGVDPETYAQVSNFGQYVLHPENQRQLSFWLREDSYAPQKKDFPVAGWKWRRKKAEYEQALFDQQQLLQEQLRSEDVEPPGDDSSDPPAPPFPLVSGTSNETVAEPGTPGEHRLDAGTGGPPIAPYGQPVAGGTEIVFDASKEQHTGVILGIALCSVRHRGQDGTVRDHFLCLPGDDVQLTLPNSGRPPKAISSRFTVVDLYESGMSEYDSRLAFIPLEEMQHLRGMIDQSRGITSVTSIQIKLKPGADLNSVRDRLQERFPVEQFGYRIQTWRDMQGPLLSAVQLETTILNILLFLIIAVAGFGILATFFMIVVEKTRDIGILKSLGAPSGGVMSIFLSYGFCLGVVGSGVGLVLGLLFVANINGIAAGLERLTGREVFDPTVYYFQSIPTIIDPWTISLVVVGAVGIAVLASILPARYAARLHPVEALRYE